VSALFIIGIYETLSSTFLISLRQKSKLLTQHIKIAKAPQSGISALLRQAFALLTTFPMRQSPQTGASAQESPYGEE